MEILRYRLINKGCVVCGFSMKIIKWGIIINDCTFFDKNGRKWITFPQRQYEDKGEKKYAPYIQFEHRPHMAAFQEKVIKALEEFMAANPAQSTQTKEENTNELPF